MSDIVNTENTVTETADSGNTDTVTETTSAKTRKRKTDEEKLAELQKEKDKLLDNERKLKSKISTKKRKERNRHLIEMGALIYSKLSREFIEGDINRMAAFIDGQDSRGNYFTDALNRGVSPEQLADAATTKKGKKDS